jgi:beta-glucosidase-like glycosyl hydrolase/CubicO group peptidase (beta-lactamase class C family)
MTHPHRLRVSRVVATALSCAALSCARLPIATVPSQSPSRPSPAFSAPLNDAARRWIEQTLAGLTLRERVAQMVTVWELGDYTSTTDSAFVEAKDWITNDGVGGVVMSLGSPIEVAAKINDFQRLAKVPLLISSDVEPGLGRLEGGVFAPYTYNGGSATILPTNMAIGATGRESNAEEAGRITGLEARAIGIHLAFAPVVDVNNNPANPVINTRSFGEDPAQVARLSAAFVRGVQGTGVAATAKHFPGHGDTDTDSHLALPVVKSDRARLESVELVPFRASIDAGIAGIMTAHIALPAIGPAGLPATLSPEIVSGLLRDSLRFRGLTVTDALSMEGVGQGYTIDKSTVMAVLAGADLLLKPTDTKRAIAAVVAAVERGEISRERIDASVRRLLELKVRVGAAEHPIVALDSLRTVVGSAEHRASARRIAQEAITLLRDERSFVPVHAGPPTVIVTYATELDIEAGRVFASELSGLLKGARVARVTPRTSRAQLDSLVRPADRVIVSTHVRTIEGAGRLSVSPSLAGWIDSLAETHPVVVAAHGNPYVIREFPRVGSYLVTYGRGPALEQAAARAMAGRAPITGRAPISLPGYFTRGDGLQRPFAAGSDDVDADGEAPPTLPVGADSLAKPLGDTLRVLLDRAVADSAFPGAYAIVGRHDRILARYGAGHLDWAASPRPDEHTLWDMASLTKVTALAPAMMQLVERGMVDLEAPVQRYLAQWTGHNKERVLVRHLLTHSSGLPAWRPLYKEAASPDSAMALVYATQLDTLPGVRMVYSDLNAILLGEIVRAVSGSRLDAYDAAHVFGPLKMRETMYLPATALRARIAPTEIDPWRQRHLRGEVHDENAYALGGVAAHAGLFSSAHDMARYARMYLNGGALDGARIASAETVRQFTTVRDSTFSPRALLWETPSGQNSAGHLMQRPAFGHTGFTGGSLWIDPAHDVFVLLLTNRVNPTRTNLRITAVRQALADAVMRVVAP